MAGIRPLLGRAKRSVCAAGRRVRCSLFPHAVSLIYHRVAELEIDSQMLAVAPGRFRAHLRHLKARYRPLSPAQLRDEMAGGGVRAGGVVITFDDGYADNLLNMLPIVEEAGVPVTVFVSTDLLGTDREFWWDELERIFLAGGSLPPRLDLPWSGGRLDWPTGDAGSIRSAYDRLHPLVKALPPAEREAQLGALRAWAGAGTAGRPSHRSLTRAELADLGRCRWVTIGAHTRSHTALSVLPPRLQYEEIRGSKEELESILGRPVDFFSYPFGGKRDYSPGTPGICRELGFSAAYSNFYGQIFTGTDPFQIPRALVRDWDEAEFERRMRGFFRS